LNVATNLMEAAFDFDLTMQWHDARLEMSPCGLVYGTILTAATSDAQQQADAATLLRTMWYPSVAMLPSTDAASGADVVYDSTQFALGNDVPWVTGTGPLDPTRNVPFARCHKCVTYTLSGTANVTLAPIWTYDFFPFDQHDISFVVSVSEAQLSSCAELLAPMYLTSSNRSQLLPATNEWELNEIAVFHPTDSSGVTRDDQCQVVVRVRRSAYVYVVKNLLMTAISVLLGLVSLFMHVENHTGDRAAMIIVSALIVTESFTKDLNLGSLTYLIWVDYFNASQLFILVPALVVVVIEHRMFVTDKCDMAITLNKTTRWALPFGYYPVLTLAMLVQGSDNGSTPAFWTILVVGFVTVTLVGGWHLHRNLRNEHELRKRTVNMLRTADPCDPGYVKVLHEAFLAFDMDNSGDISVKELRMLLEIVFPTASRVQLSHVMKETRHFGSKEGNFFEHAFVDAVLCAVKAMHKLEHDVNYDAMPLRRLLEEEDGTLDRISEGTERSLRRPSLASMRKRPASMKKLAVAVGETADPDSQPPKRRSFW